MLGFIINPIAGMGGAVGFHGTDGPAVQAAKELGATPVAPPRAARALTRIAAALPGIGVVAAPGVMGADLARACGLATHDLEMSIGDPTVAADTTAASKALNERGVDLVLFAGGDGTARDIVAAIGPTTPMLGVPAGVKMHSGVFGRTPEAAAEIAIRFLRQPGDTPLRDVEVMDVAVDDQTLDVARARLFASARIPFVPALVQRAKASPIVHDEGAVDALCVEIAESMQRDRLYIVGPGTTTARVLYALGCPATLMGVDVVRNGSVVAADASEQTLLGLLADGTPASLLLGVIGGQGFLLGRGNQQISLQVLAAISPDDITIIASAEKVMSLDPAALYVDFGDDAPASPLEGYRKVRTGLRSSAILKVIS